MNQESSPAIGPLPLFLPRDDLMGKVGETSQVLLHQVQINTLNRLLSLPFQSFVSHVLHNTELSLFLDSFLNNRKRRYECLLEPQSSDNDGTCTLLDRLVFLVYYRLFMNEGRPTSSQNAKAPNPDLPETFEQQLIELPKVLDICSLYGFTNPALVSRLLEAAFRKQPHLWKELEDCGQPLTDVLYQISNRILGAGIKGDDEEASLDDLLRCLSDIMASLSRLGQAVPAAGNILAGMVDVFLSVRMIYGQAFDRLMRNGGPQREKYCRFVRRCILTLLNGVVESIISTAMVESADSIDQEKAYEHLFTLMTKLIQAEEELDEMMIADLTRRFALKAKLESLLIPDAGPTDKSGVSYLLQLLEVTVRHTKEHSSRRRGNGHARKAESADVRKVEQHDAAAAVNDKPTFAQMKGSIDEVKQVCPGLGDGFVHACLAMMGYNPHAVVNALLEGSSLPYPIGTLDRSLPSPLLNKMVDERRVQPAQEERDEDFIKLQKAYLRNRERDEEEENYVMQEYDDDYDDQYEESDGFTRDVGNRDDFDAIRRFNAIKRREEEEDKYWEDLRNPNVKGALVSPDGEGEEGKEEEEEREAASGGKAAAGGGARDREQEGGGGRGGGGNRHQLPPLARGTTRVGGGGRGEGAAVLSDQQKKRKGQNKARRAYHNRKAGATRKAMGGSFSRPDDR